MPLTAWRIGFAAVACDRCGRADEVTGQPNGYAVLLRRGWTEVPVTDGRFTDPTRLRCPDCAVTDEDHLPGPRSS